MAEFMDTTKTLLVESSCYCCGLFEIGNFNGDPRIIDYDLEFLTKKESFELDNYEDDDGEEIITTANFTLYATLGEYQWLDYEPLLLKHGFKKVSEFKNPNSDNYVRMYVYTPPEIEKV